VSSQGLNIFIFFEISDYGFNCSRNTLLGLKFNIRGAEIVTTWTSSDPIFFSKFACYRKSLHQGSAIESRIIRVKYIISFSRFLFFEA